MAVTRDDPTTAEAAHRASDPGDLLELVRSAEEDAMVAVRPASEAFLEIGDEVLDAPPSEPVPTPSVRTGAPAGPRPVDPVPCGPNAPYSSDAPDAPGAARSASELPRAFGGSPAASVLLLLAASIGCLFALTTLGGLIAPMSR